MTTLAEARQAIADGLEANLDGGEAVSPYPPKSVSAPHVFVGEVTMRLATIDAGWDATIVVWILTQQSPRTEQIQFLEEMVAPNSPLFDGLADTGDISVVPVEVDIPRIVNFGNTEYLGAKIDCEILL